MMEIKLEIDFIRSEVRTEFRRETSTFGFEKNVLPLRECLHVVADFLNQQAENYLAEVSGDA